MALENLCGFNNLSFMRGAPGMEYIELEDKIIQGTMDKSAYTLMAPPFDNPAEKFQDNLNQNKIKLNLIHGTTTLAFKYANGIIMCADLRDTVNDFSIAKKKKKIIELDKCMLGTISGCAGDCSYWQRVLAMECRLYRLEHDEEMPVTSASKIIQNITDRLIEMGVTMELFLAGSDPDGLKLIFIDSNGNCTEGNMFALGCGISHAYSVLHNGFNWNMSDNAAYNLARRAACQTDDLNISRFFKLYHLKENGWHIIPEITLPKYNFAEPMDID